MVVEGHTVATLVGPVADGVAAHMRAVPICGHDGSMLAAGARRDNSTSFAGISLGRQPATLVVQMKNPTGSEAP